MKKNKYLLLVSTLTLLLTGCDFFNNFPINSSSAGESSGSPSESSQSQSSESESSESESSESAGESSSQTVPSSEVPSSSENGSTSQGSSNETDKEGYRLVWSDEFSGTKVNAQNWSPQVGDGSPNYGWGNQEKQWYTGREENLFVENGNLVITARKEKIDERRDFEYTSARIRSAGKVSTKYGYIEARIKLPAITGLWPAFWMLPEYPSPYGGWPNSGEIDIMEARGRVPDMMTSALHYGGNPANNGGHSEYRSAGYEFKNSTIAEFHTYGVRWEEELIEWFVDDNSYFTMQPAAIRRGGWYSGSNGSGDLAPFDTEFHLLLNMAVGGHFDEHRLPPSDFVAAEMLVDYVRIYDFA